MKSYQKWSSSPEKQVAEKQVAKPSTSVEPPLNSAPIRDQSLAGSSTRQTRGRDQNISMPGTEVSDAKMTPRRSTRKPKPPEATVKVEQSNRDIVLSLYDETYRDIMWKQYNILGRKELRAREEAVVNQLFQSMKQSLGRKGRFWKKVTHGDELYMVDDDEAFESKF